MTELHLTRRSLISNAAAGVLGADKALNPRRQIPGKTVVLTLDDAVKSHRTFAGPLLKELGFGATFFVTHRWMDDVANFMTWEEIAELHRMGFEIGNHSWTHPNFGSPKHAARLGGELALVDYRLRQVNVPRPVSFAYTGNGFGPEAVARLRELGYRYARRGGQPEVSYGKMEVGAAFDPSRHHPLLIPTTGDAYPDWTLEHFQRVLAKAEPGRIVVLQFHGVPDIAHPWVHTPPERFSEYMAYLKEQGYHVLALRDVEQYLPAGDPPRDSMLKARHPVPKDGRLEQPPEVTATRADLGYWLDNMLRRHRYTVPEAAAVAGLTHTELRREAEARGLQPSSFPRSSHPSSVILHPYPGGRHPRIGFLDGAVDPHRGTKASVFLPWDPAGYVVVDLPEAIFSNLGLTYLAHTHIPTIWDEQGVVIDNVDWTRHADGSLEHRRTLPNGIRFGATIRAAEAGADMEMWLRNGTAASLTALRTQVCVMLKGAPGFTAQTNDNKILRAPLAAARSESGDRWIITAWERCGRAWANPPCPCIHSDPVFPDCPPGATVRLRGRLRFYQGKDIEGEIARLIAG